MSNKQRTIPITQKEEIQVQTDVNLINHALGSFANQERQSNYVHMSEISSANGFIRPFSDLYIFQQFSQLIKQIKESGQGGQKIEQRLGILERQIQGLMKRDLLLNQGGQGKSASKNYYDALGQKDKEVYNLQYKLAYNDIKVRRYERRTKDLQLQLQNLNKAINANKQAMIQNQLYRQLFKSVKTIVYSSKNKVKQLQKLIDQKIIPSLSSYQLDIQNISRNIDRKTDNELKSFINYYAKELDQMVKNNEISSQKLNESLLGLYETHKFLDNSQKVISNLTYKQRFTELDSKYNKMVSLFKSQLQMLQQDNSNIKGLKNIQQLINLVSKQDIELINCSGWIGIGCLQKQNVQVHVQDQNTKNMIKILATTLKSFTQKYPKILQEIKTQVKFFLQKGEFLEELIQAQSLNRLKEIVVYQQQAIRVDNIYNYSNKKDQDLIFHLRVLIKSLMQELQRIRLQNNCQLALDIGILQLLRNQIIEGIDVNSILKLYRPLPQIVEVEKIVQRPVYVNGTLEKGIPIRTQKPILAQYLMEKAIQVIKQVPIYIEKPIDNIIKQYVQINIQTQRVLEVPTIRDLIVEKVITNQVLKQVQVEKIVPLYEQKFIEIVNNKEIVIENSKIVQIQKPVQVRHTQFEIVQKIIQKPVYLRETKEKIKQVQVINQKILQKDKYIQIQRQIPHIITNREIVYIEREVPKFITNTQEKQIIVTQLVQKIVPYKVYEEKVIQVPVVQEKQIVKQVSKQVIMEATHFIKGDRQTIFKQVEVIVQKPYREEFIINKEIQIQKVVPMYIKEQKPVYIQIQTPYIQQQPKIITQEVPKIVTVRQEIIKQVKVQVPVPVITEKEVIKIQTVIIQKVVQKIVQVPRVIQVQRIVQKIVVIPRIIQKIVEVPRIVEKIVTVEVPYLQIVEVIRQVPVVRQVEIIKYVYVDQPKIQIVKDIEVVQKERIVQIVVEKQIPKIVQTERRIPTQVIRQIPVEMFKDRIVQKIIQIHEVTVKDRQVLVPFIQQIPVQFIVQKPVVTEKIVQKIVNVDKVIQKTVCLKNTLYQPQIVEIQVQRPVQIQVVRQIQGPETIRYIDNYRQIEVIRQKIVELQNTIQIPRQVFVYMDKIVHEYHQKFNPIRVPQIVQHTRVLQISKPQHFIHYKEIPVQVQTNRNVPVRSIINQIKQVTKQVHHQHEVQIVKQKIKEIVRQTQCFIQRQVQKQILREVVVNQSKHQLLQVTGETKILQTNQVRMQILSEPNYVQKIVQRIIMLPQIVQVVKHIHQISEVQSLGIAVNTTIQDHTRQYLGVSTQLKSALEELLAKFKQSSHRQPDLKNLIVIIEKHLKKIADWIKFPKIIQIPKEVQKLVQKQRVVLVPTQDHRKQASLSYLVQKLVTQLKRIRDRNRIDLQLDEQITKLFFKDRQTRISGQKLQSLEQQLKRKYDSFGQWTQSHPFMMNAFVQDYFNLQTIIQQNKKIKAQQEDRIKILNKKLSKTSEQIISLSSYNAEVIREYSELVSNLKAKKEPLTTEQIKVLLSSFNRTKQQQSRLIKSNIRSQVSHSERKSQKHSSQIQQSSQKASKQMSKLISQVSSLQGQNNQISNKNKQFQQQIKNLKLQLERSKTNTQNYQSSTKVQNNSSNAKVIQQIRSKLTQQNDSKIKRLQESHVSQLERLKQTQQRQLERMKSQRQSASNTQTNNQNRKISEQLRNIKRDLQTEKRNSQNLAKHHQRQMQALKKQHELNLQKKQINNQLLQKIKTKITEEYQSKINQMKQAHDRQVDRLRTFSAKRQENKQHKNAQVDFLQDKIRQLEVQLETSKKEVQIYQKSRLAHTTYTSQFASEIKQTSQITGKYSPQHQEYQRSPKIQIYKSTFDKGYVSPSNSSVKSKQQDSQRVSSSSKRSDRSVSKYKAQMTLKQFMDIKENQDRDLCSTFIMIKVIQKIEEQVQKDLLHSFSPNNIYLSGLNPKNLQNLAIKFGAPITNKNNKNDGLYLSPEILSGKQTTSRKSIVFTLGVIWDELIHGDPYFKSISEIQNIQYEFKVRDHKLNPILKNTLFQMMNKDFTKRLQLSESKRRLSLQKYIASQSKSITKKYRRGEDI